MSLLAPSFLARLEDPEVKTILVVGCGGGFDFVHGMVLYPELVRLGKKVVIGSNSFGDPSAIHGAQLVKRFESDERPFVVKATALLVHLTRATVLRWVSALFWTRSTLCAPPHSVYAYYARHYTVPMLTELYQGWITEHQVDAVVLIDGGSDSLMAGDECGLGDPIQDCVSVVTVSELKGVKARILISVGFGCDRFNNVADASSLRAVAELSKTGGFLGSVSLEPSSVGFQFYSDCIDFLQRRAAFRSVIANSIVAAGQGTYGYDIPPTLRARVGHGSLYL